MANDGHDDGSTHGIVPRDGGGSNEALVASKEPGAGKSKTKRTWIFAGLALAALLIIVAVVIGVLVGKKVIKTEAKAKTTAGSASDNASSTLGSQLASSTTQATPTIFSSSPSSSSTVSSSSSSTTSSGSEPTSCSTPDSIPAKLKGTYMDPTSWLDMTDFNCTFTSDTVGGLPIVGLNSTWDDSTQANPTVPPLNKTWTYGQQPIRGVNLGGWFSLEPFITPSLFQYPSSLGIIDEYTLCAHLGLKDATTALEKHYSTFITEDDFKAIANAGLDHVRIPFSYWAVTTYDNDPYAPNVSWRYLLRAIEWARKYGLRVNLDLHAVPGSQNGWNHSGRQGGIGWILGSNGATNAQRSLDLHNQLSKFFAQDRYKNVVAFYGLLNEPGFSIPMSDLVQWTEKAYSIVHGNGVSAIQVFSESFRGLGMWAGQLSGYGNSLVIDVHEYTIFDSSTLKAKHADRIPFACDSFASSITASMNKSPGFGPTMVGEWSQADTDCAQYLNGVGSGARWDGTFFGSTPSCPTLDSQCSCEQANADPSTYTSQYKSFLITWAEAQMSAFEKSWGWFYWTWKTESAPLWSYQAGLQGNFLPAVAYKRSWSCSDSVPNFDPLPEYY